MIGKLAAAFFVFVLGACVGTIIVFVAVLAIGFDRIAVGIGLGAGLFSIIYAGAFVGGVAFLWLYVIRRKR